MYADTHTHTYQRLWLWRRGGRALTAQRGFGGFAKGLDEAF